MPEHKNIFSDIIKANSMVGKLHPFCLFWGNCNVPKAAQDSVFDILEARNCPLKASEFDKIY